MCGKSAAPIFSIAVSRSFEAQFRKLGFEKSVQRDLGEDPVFKVFLAIACLVAGAFAPNRADGASNVVQYVYDAAGNIVGIQRLNPAPITFTGFAPTSGPVVE